MLKTSNSALSPYCTMARVPPLSVIAPGFVAPLFQGARGLSTRGLSQNDSLTLTLFLSAGLGADRLLSLSLSLKHSLSLSFCRVMGLLACLLGLWVPWGTPACRPTP